MNSWSALFLFALLFIIPALTSHGVVLGASAMAVFALGWRQGSWMTNGSRRAAALTSLALFALWLLNAWRWQG